MLKTAFLFIFGLICTQSLTANAGLKTVNCDQNGDPADTSLYYPNGKLYAIEQKPVAHSRTLFIECRDTAGKVLAEKGNGTWIKYDTDFKHIIEKGPVVNGLRDGEGHDLLDDSVKFIEIYKQGDFVSVTDPNESKYPKRVFTKVEKEPSFKYGGSAGFSLFLGNKIKYPAYDREHNIQGRVVVTFVVEKDGSLSDVKALLGPDELLKEAAVDAIKQSPLWYPGIQNGRTVRVQYTISFNFNAGNK